MKVGNVYFGKTNYYETTEITFLSYLEFKPFLLSDGGRKKQDTMSENVHATVPLTLTTEKFSRKFMFQFSYTKEKEEKNCAEDKQERTTSKKSERKWDFEKFTVERTKP